MGNKQRKEKGMDGYKWSVVNVNNVALKTFVIIMLPTIVASINGETDTLISFFLSLKTI
jgi:hypothetical protein